MAYIIILSLELALFTLLSLLKMFLYADIFVFAYCMSAHPNCFTASLIHTVLLSELVSYISCVFLHFDYFANLT